MKRFVPRLSLGLIASTLAFTAQAQRPTTSVGYFPESVRVEGASPVYHFHIVDVSSPNTVTGETTAAVRFNNEALPGGVADEVALSHIKGIVELPLGTVTPLIENDDGVMVPWADELADYDESIVRPWLVGIVGKTSGVLDGLQTLTYNASLNASEADTGIVSPHQAKPRPSESFIRVHQMHSVEPMATRCWSKTFRRRI